MKFQPVSGKPLRQHFMHAPRVILPFECDDKVIRISHEKRAPTQPRQHLTVKPQVEHFMQIDVRQKR
jgi:hypothetical protein